MVLMWVAVLNLYCSAGADDSAPAASVGSGPGAGVNPLGRARCQAPAGVTSSPGTIEGAVLLLNALPKPTGVACFVESLARPLTVFATNSPFSAQPAFSPSSPRVFVKLGRLWLSVVIDGESSYLMEFGYLVGGEELRSIKAELLLPIDEPVAPSAPYDRVLHDGRSMCGLCHYDEQRVAEITFAEAYSSIAFRPRPDSKVTIESLRAQHQSCDWQLEPHRCEMLSAVFDGGEVVESSFPSSMVTFY